MARNVGSDEVMVDAPAGAVYRYLADMRDHHPRFLPLTFSDFRVESGSAGRHGYAVQDNGRQAHSRVPDEVAEPEPAGSPPNLTWAQAR
jgi:hypothetical protein